MYDGIKGFSLFLLVSLQGKPENTTYRHNSHSLRDLDTRTRKPGYLPLAQGESLQVCS